MVGFEAYIWGFEARERADVGIKREETHNTAVDPKGLSLCLIRPEEVRNSHGNVPR
jgi:hypothetical protein